MVNTKDLQRSFKSEAILETENVRLKRENIALNVTITKLCNEINNIRGLDRKLTTIYLSPEEEICTIQLYQLQEISKERKLTLEEVKTLDLLIKNKRLINKKSTSNPEITLPANLSDDELARIAESVEEKDQKGIKS